MNQQCNKTGSPRARLLCVLALISVCASCVPAADDNLDAASNADMFTWNEPHMGTIFIIRVSTSAERKAAADEAVAGAFQRIAEINQVCSDYVTDSEIRTITRSPAGEAVKISDTLAKVLVAADTLAAETKGAFDPTIGPLIRQWRMSRKNSRLPSAAALSNAQLRSGYTKLTITPATPSVTVGIEGMQLDLGGIAKGYAADEALKILRETGFPHSLVAASGDIVVGMPPTGTTAWRVGIRGLKAEQDETHAEGSDHTEVQLPADLTGLIELKNAAISTSGDLNQWIELDGVRYSHIVDPHTGLGLTRRCSVTVIAPTAIESDSLATACSVLEKDKALALIQKRGAGYHIRIREINDHGRIVITESADFPAAVAVEPTGE
jgi:thiamine biosynthesis lipoprotein